MFRRLCVSGIGCGKGGVMGGATTQAFLAAPLHAVETPTARVAYRRFGSGPALLLVHGFPLSGFTWRRVLPRLAERHTCYVPDVPGMGETEWTDATDFSFPGQGRTLKAFVDALGIDRFSVLAQDTGGTFARYLALEVPTRVEKLMLVNTEMPGHRPPWIPLYQFLMGVPGTLTVFGFLLRSNVYLRSSMGFGGCFVDMRHIEGDFHAHVVEPLKSSPRRMDGMRRYLRGAVWGPVDDLAREHARLTMPVLLIWGADDPTFPVALARDMVGQFPNARIAEIPGAKLLVHEEKSAEVARLALDFLA
jgi:pimeloyl-ACP methyl ester carboxylesterase